MFTRLYFYIVEVFILNLVKTLDFGYIPIRKTHTQGETLQFIELCDGTMGEIKLDYNTNQPFIVLYEE